MITIQPEIEILSTESYEDMLRRIEKIGRVCYKSEEHIGEGTAEKFIAGINAAARMNGISYSVLMNGLKQRNITINRKMLADIAVNDPAAFTKLVETVKG